MDGARDFSEGYAVVGVGIGDSERFGFIDKSGKWHISPKFMVANSFTEGMAPVVFEHTVSDFARKKFKMPTGDE
ncbi:MAG TPA: WG repeat-containing protein [Oculatellaceae cyanobacterium]